MPISRFPETLNLHLNPARSYSRIGLSSLFVPPSSLLCTSFVLTFELGRTILNPIKIDGDTAKISLAMISGYEQSSL